MWFCNCCKENESCGIVTCVCMCMCENAFLTFPSWFSPSHVFVCYFLFQRMSILLKKMLVVDESDGFDRFDDVILYFFFEEYVFCVFYEKHFSNQPRKQKKQQKNIKIVTEMEKERAHLKEFEGKIEGSNLNLSFTHQNDSILLSVVGEPSEGCVAKFKRTLTPQTLSKLLPDNLKPEKFPAFLKSCVDGEKHHVIKIHFEKG